MFISNIFLLAQLASATRIIVRQENTNPVEPTVVEDGPTASNTINFSGLEPSSNTDSDVSDPTFFVQTTLPTITGDDLITISGTNVPDPSDAPEDDASHGETTTVVPVSTTTMTTSTEENGTGTAEDAEQTDTASDDAAPTVRPGKVAAGVAVALGLAFL